jgi:hypothetical protein
VNQSEKILAMKFHEKITFNDFDVVKVHGGWIYLFYAKHYNTDGNMISGSQAAVFVPNK